jgi:poly(3-hydroxybutyrate) depolymerase
MNRIFSIITVIALSLIFVPHVWCMPDDLAPEAEPGKRVRRLPLEGVLRETIVYRPANLPANKPVPVVFVFHGTGGDGETAYENYGWKEKADQEGFMIVCPSARRYRIFQETLVKNGQVLHNVQQFTTKWNFFGLEDLLDPAYPNQRLYDDVRFVQGIIAILIGLYHVDETRFYVTGFSNGSQFAQRLFIQMSDVFAAFAFCGSGRGWDQDDLLQPNAYTNAPFRQRPALHVIGELDPKLNYAAGVTAFPLDESAAAPGTWTYDAVMKPYATLLGLPPEYQYRRTERASTFHFGTFGATPEFGFSIVEGMRHIYPNGENFSFALADVFWPFMKQHQR